jgi:hypothetical protein
VIAHVVLFRPRAELTDAERSALIDAFARALKNIPSIRRSRVGQRVTHGRPGYERMMSEDYDHIAVIEFDDLEGLKAYLDHPAHKELAQRFFSAFEAALMYDFEFPQNSPLT